MLRTFEFCIQAMFEIYNQIWKQSRKHKINRKGKKEKGKHKDEVGPDLRQPTHVCAPSSPLLYHCADFWGPFRSGPKHADWQIGSAPPASSPRTHTAGGASMWVRFYRCVVHNSIANPSLSQQPRRHPYSCLAIVGFLGAYKSTPPSLIHPISRSHRGAHRWEGSERERGSERMSHHQETKVVAV